MGLEGEKITPKGPLLNPLQNRVKMSFIAKVLYPRCARSVSHTLDVVFWAMDAAHSL